MTYYVSSGTLNLTPLTVADYVKYFSTVWLKSLHWSRSYVVHVIFEKKIWDLDL